MQIFTILISNAESNAILTLTPSSELEGTWTQCEPLTVAFVRERWGYFKFVRDMGGNISHLALLHNDVKRDQTEPFPWAWLVPSWGGNPDSWSGGKMGWGCLWRGARPGQGSTAANQPRLGFQVLEKPPFDWSQLWAGPALHVDAQIGSRRGEYMIGYLANMISYQVVYYLALAEDDGGSSKGAGGGGCFSVCVATKIPSPQRLRNLKFAGEDINVTLGLGWSKLLKFMGKTKVLASMVPAIEDIGKMAETDSKAEGKMSGFKALVATWGIDPSEPSYTCWDTPVGVGFELSYAKTKGEIVWTADVFDLPVIKSYIARYHQSLAKASGAPRPAKTVEDDPLRYGHRF
jgi:hypothetical protein